MVYYICTCIRIASEYTVLFVSFWLCGVSRYRDVKPTRVNSCGQEEVFWLFNVCPGRRLRAVFRFVMKEKVYRIDRITAKELSKFSGKSLNTCKALLSKIGTKLENHPVFEVKSGSVTVKSPADSYQPEPVQKPKFNFKGLSQTEIEGC